MTALAPLTNTLPTLVQPVRDIAAALAERVPHAHWSEERELYATLPDSVRTEIRTLLGADAGGGVFGWLRGQVDAGMTVGQAAADARREFNVRGSVARLRARYDLWDKSGDWTSLVNRSKAGTGWTIARPSLPAEFVSYCAKIFGRFKRADGKRQALASIIRTWASGVNARGEREEIPGYGFRKPGQPESMPGWSYSNVLDAVRRAGAFTPTVRALMHQGAAAAHSHLPMVRFDRNQMGADGGPLRFLERVEFDDVKCDFLIIDTATGQACDLWLLIARDLGTAMLLGFGMRPARTREDGSQVHLKLRDMRQLTGWILERFGLPPYVCNWKMERGTATIPKPQLDALSAMLPGRIAFSFSSMLGGDSPAGYAERGLGNSKAKASLESQNRIIHTMLADQPGQTGPLYTVRPADLASRAREAREIWESAHLLPPHLRSGLGYPLLTVGQAKDHLWRVFQLQNQRTDHDLQGFDDVAEYLDLASGEWRQGACPVGAQARRRRESPIERCARLSQPYLGQWSQVGPDIIRAFYEHTVRAVVVKPSGMIEFRVDDRSVEFAPPGQSHALVPGTKALGYSHPDDPRFLHISDAQGRILGTWLRRDRTGDRESVTEAIRYQAAALRAARATADTYAADERAALEQMRADNATLLARESFIDVSEPAAAHEVLRSPLAAALTQARPAVKRAAKADADSARAAMDALMDSIPD